MIEFLRIIVFTLIHITFQNSHMTHYTMKQKFIQLTTFFVAIPVTFIILGIIIFIIDNNPLLRQIIDLLGHLCVMGFLGWAIGHFIGKVLIWLWERA